MIEEPKLMPFQYEPFNGDINLCGIVKEFVEVLNIKKAVETGTCLGYTTAYLSTLVDYVATVESNFNFYSIARQNRLDKRENVKCYIGKSDELLLQMLEQGDFDDKTLIFLDAHWYDNNPLKAELRQIKEYGIKPFIMIHDCLVPSNKELGFDIINGESISYEYIKDELNSIYDDDYYYFYNEEAVGAKRGVLLALTH